MYASPSAASLAEWHRRQSSGRCLVGALDSDVRETVPRAARRVLARLGFERTAVNSGAPDASSPDDTRATHSDSATEHPRHAESAVLSSLRARFEQVRRTLPAPSHTDESRERRSHSRSRSRSVSPTENETPSNWFETLLNAIANGELPTVAREHSPLKIARLRAAFVHICNSGGLRTLGASDHGRLCRAGTLMSVLCKQVNAEHWRCYVRLRFPGREANERHTWYAFTEIGFRDLAAAARDMSVSDALAAVNRPRDESASACPSCGHLRICVECDVARPLDEASDPSRSPAQPSGASRSLATPLSHAATG